MVIMKCETDLFEIIAALHSTSGNASRRAGGNYECCHDSAAYEQASDDAYEEDHNDGDCAGPRF